MFAGISPEKFPQVLALGLRAGGAALLLGLISCGVIWTAPPIAEDPNPSSSGVPPLSGFLPTNAAPVQAARNQRPQLSPNPSLKEIVEYSEANAQSGDSTAALESFGHHWFYGQGIGRTIANVGGVVLFPPYALYLVGNAGLSLSGYEPLWVSRALPEPVREYTLTIYDGITSVPGRLTAVVSGEEFQKDAPRMPAAQAALETEPEPALTP